MNKKELRIKYLKIREKITEKEEKSKIIADMLLSFDVLKEAKIVGIYVSMKNEVNTHEIIKKLILEGKKVCVPLTKEDCKMVFIKINSIDNMSINKFGMLEPKDGTKVEEKDIDVMVMPGVCFDKYGNRVGFGKGYYDRFLEGSRNTKKIAIAFSDQIVHEKIEYEKYDVKYDFLITENEIITL